MSQKYPESILHPAEDRLKRAKAGDPQAIAALLNQSLHPRGVTARAIVRDSTLRIMLDAQALPKQAQLVPHLEKALQNLSPQGIETISISGFQSGLSRPTWIHHFQISSQPTVALDPLRLFLADLDEDTLISLTQHLQVPPSGRAELHSIPDRIDRWRSQAQALTEGELQHLEEPELAQMALCLRILQLHRLHPEDLMLLLAGL